MHKQLLIPVILASPTIQAVVVPRQSDSDSTSRPAGDFVRNFFGRLGQGASNVLNVNYLNAQKVAYGAERNQLDQQPSNPSMDFKRDITQQPLFWDPPPKSRTRKLQGKYQIPLMAQDSLVKQTSRSPALSHDDVNPIIRRDDEKLTATFLDNAALVTHTDPGTIGTVHDEDQLGVHTLGANTGAIQVDLLKHVSHGLDAAESILQETVLALNPSSSNGHPGGAIRIDAIKQGTGQVSSTNSVLQDDIKAVYLPSLKGVTHDMVHDAAALNPHMAAQSGTANTDILHSNPVNLVSANVLQDGSLRDSPLTKSEVHPPITVDFARPDHWPDKRQLMQGNNVLNAIVRWLPIVEEIGVRATYDEYRNRAEPAKDLELMPVANGGQTMVLGWRQWCFATAFLIVGILL